MAMTKEQQKAASDRIIAKEPLTEEELRTYKRLTMKPGEYPRPGLDRRECQECGATFQTVPATKESPEVSALQQFSDHTAEHNPPPAQWAEAYRRIEAGKASSTEN